MRCCRNCEWSISPELEDEIMEEQGYEEDDPDRPQAGECVIGQKHSYDTYVCKSHLYCDGTQETHLMYDKEYLGEGIFIITTVNDEIESFMKISRLGPMLSIRGYEVGESDTQDDEFRTIIINIEKNHPYYMNFKTLADEINNQKIFSINQYLQGKNNIEIISNADGIKIKLNKDIYGVKQSANFVDITIDEEHNGNYYKALLDFYKNILTFVINQKDTMKVHNITKKELKKILKPRR